MERWRGKVAIVTGASMGIGAAIAIRLIREGVTVVGIARRVELIEALRDKVADPTRLHALKCDLTQEADIRMAFEYVERELGGIDILVNNAASGNSGMHYVDEDNANDLRQILETNVLGLVLCTREAFQSMRRRGVDGHVVMLGSICGRIVPKLPELGAMNMYVASKYAVTAIAEQIRQEFHELGTQIKISTLSPGLVDTEMLSETLRRSGPPMLHCDDVCDALVYVLGTPPKVQVSEVIMRTLGERN